MYILLNVVFITTLVRFTSAQRATAGYLGLGMIVYCRRVFSKYRVYRLLLVVIEFRKFLLPCFVQKLVGTLNIAYTIP